jgi:hypothetical protein
MAQQVRPGLTNPARFKGHRQSVDLIRRQPAYSIRARGQVPFNEAECMAAISTCKPEPKMMLGNKGASMYEPRRRDKMIDRETALVSKSYTALWKPVSICTLGAMDPEGHTERRYGKDKHRFFTRRKDINGRAEILEYADRNGNRFRVFERAGCCIQSESIEDLYAKVKSCWACGQEVASSRSGS